MSELMDTLIAKYGNVTKTAKVFGVTHTAVVKWKTKGAPLHVALLCHLSKEIPYIFNPSDYKVDMKGLGIKIKQKKVTTNDSVKPVSNANINDHCRAS